MIGILMEGTQTESDYKNAYNNNAKGVQARKEKGE